MLTGVPSRKEGKYGTDGKKDWKTQPKEKARLQKELRSIRETLEGGIEEH